MSEAADSIVIMQARDGRRLAKTLLPDGTFLNYDDAFKYNAETVSLDGLADLWPLLHWLLPRHDRCVVRGRLIAGDTARNTRRLLYKDKKTGDQPTLADVPRYWLALDVDSIPRPPDVDAADLLACADVAMSFLPPAFRQAPAIIQGTAGHGIKPGCRLRLWFWCSRPMIGAELKRWLQTYPVDRSVFGAAQPVYTAAPIFAAGVTDHLPRRLAKWRGAGVLAVPSAEELKPPPAKPATPPEAVASPPQAERYVRAALARAADAIMTAGEGARHETLVKEARGMGRFVAADLLRACDVHAVLSRAAELAGKTDTAEIASCIDWGLANPSRAALPANRHAA